MEDGDSICSSSSSSSLPVSQSYLYEQVERLRNTRRKQKQRNAITAYYTPVIGASWANLRGKKARNNQTYRVRTTE